MKRTLSIICLVLTAVALHAEQASSILARAAEKFAKSKSITATYTVAADGQTMNGTITVAGDKFTIDSREVKSWYDGRTQWTYSSEIDEVNITEPTPEELAQVNPFAIINSFRANFNSRTLSESNGVATIEMLPKTSAGDMKKIVLTLNTSTLFPSKIVITTKSGSTLTITVKSISEGMILPDSKFRFSPSMLPGVEVIDLR